MLDIAALVESLGGMAQKQQLVARGARDLDLTLAVRRGDVSRARQGWYTTLPLDDPRVRAVCVGGRLTGISAVIALGGWALGRFPLHVSVHDNAARLRTPWSRFVRLAGRIVRGLTLHWDDSAIASRGDAMLVDVRDALLRVVLDEQFETAVAALDWALHTGRLDRIDFELLVLRLPKDMRHISEWVDERCESLPESLARTRLRLLGHSVESQVRVNDLERIDLVVDDCVGLETDGEEFHFDRFESDRTKDIAITIANLHALRPSARMVFRQWHRVALAVETAIAARSLAGAGHAVSRVRQLSPLARRGRGWPRPGPASGRNASGPARRSTRASGAMMRLTQLSVSTANHPLRE
jgi:hypothetical protein